MDPIEQALLTTLPLTEKYDATLKELLSNRQFLSRILKRFVREYMDITLEDIEKKYIEPDSISVSKIGVGRDTTNIVGLCNEDVTKTEGIVQYDILFHTIYPDEKTSAGEQKYIGIYINLEFQNDYYPGYPLETRAMFYVARKLSSQLPYINRNTNYACLQKVYSIWLCIGDNVPKSRADTAVQYLIQKNDLIGTCDVPEEYYDLMEVIMAYIRDDIAVTDTTMAILQAACSKRLTRNEKLTIMKKNGMKITKEIERKVDRMCTCGEAIQKQSFDQGINKFAELIQWLNSHGRADDIVKVSTDKDLREQLFKEMDNSTKSTTHHLT